MDNEYIDPNYVYAIKKLYSEFSDKNLEKIIENAVEKPFSKISLTKYDLNKLKKLNIFNDAKIIFEIISGEIKMYIEFYDKILNKITKIGIANTYINIEGDLKEFEIQLFLDRFLEMINKIPEKDMDIILINKDFPVFIKTKSYLGMIAGLKPD